MHKKQVMIILMLSISLCAMNKKPKSVPQLIKELESNPERIRKMDMLNFLNYVTNLQNAHLTAQSIETGNTLITSFVQCKGWYPIFNCFFLTLADPSTSGEN